MSTVNFIIFQTDAKDEHPACGGNDVKGIYLSVGDALSAGEFAGGAGNS